MGTAGLRAGRNNITLWEGDCTLPVRLRGLLAGVLGVGVGLGEVGGVVFQHFVLVATAELAGERVLRGVVVEFDGAFG